MKITEKKLKGNITLICKVLLKENRFDDANWLITKAMTEKQCIEYAIFVAKQVLNNFEKEYPEDKEPTLAIEAVERYLKNPCKKTKDAARIAAYEVYISYTAANATIHEAIYSIARAVIYVACTTTDTVNAFRAAAYAYKAVRYIANVATDATMKAKIIENGLRILQEGE